MGEKKTKTVRDMDWFKVDFEEDFGGKVAESRMLQAHHVVVHENVIAFQQLLSPHWTPVTIVIVPIVRIKSIELVAAWMPEGDLYVDPSKPLADREDNPADGTPPSTIIG